MLAGKIRCICGKTRAGEGPQKGKHLYYRCSDRVSSFPLPHVCNEKGINARIADKLVWDRIEDLMSSPELLQAQLNRWNKARENKVVSAVGDVKEIKKEITKLKDQEVRYNKGYGAGLFTIEQLKEYTSPIKEQINSLEYQISKAKQQENKIKTTAMPDTDEIKSFTEESAQVLPELSFELKRAIITNVVDKVVGTQQKLEVSGYMPITSIYVKHKTSYRDCRFAECGEIHAF